MLFTFAAYLGTAMTVGPGGWLGGLWALIAVFIPSILLVQGALPFWDALRLAPAAQAALRGTNAAVVGIHLAALYDPVWIRGFTARRTSSSPSVPSDCCISGRRLLGSSSPWQRRRGLFFSAEAGPAWERSIQSGLSKEAY